MKTSLVGLLAGLGLSMSVATYGFAQDISEGSKDAPATEYDVSATDALDSSGDEISTDAEQGAIGGGFEVVEGGDCDNGACERGEIDFEVYPSETVDVLPIDYSMVEVTMTAAPTPVLAAAVPGPATYSDNDDRVAPAASAPISKVGCMLGKIFSANKGAAAGCSGS